MNIIRQNFVFLVLSILVVGLGVERCEATGKFGFEVHHMFSDKVKQTLGFEVPEQGSLEYFKVLAHRDLFIRGRGLASNNVETPITFSEGNLTAALDLLGFLHYAGVSVGTPAKLFLVALDTNSDLFWVPCDCGTSCIRDLKDAGFSQSLPLEIYSPNASSTSSSIRCNDTRCFGSRGCSSPSSICPYQIPYSATTTSTGTLLQDVLHLVTEDVDLKPIQANITLGCGQNQTGLFQKIAAVNGLLGLGMKEYSVPSLLAKANITANSFSICFGRVIDVVGRISLGDKGYTDQEETPFVTTRNMTYGVNVTGITVGEDPVEVSIFAEFDSGSSFTRLLEPGYGIITQSIDDLMDNKRRPLDPDFPFEFCYDESPSDTISVELTFVGGSKMTLMTSFFQTTSKDDTKMYCLGILKTTNFNIIGQNLMSGHRIVFDRERKILGWKHSDCFQDESLESMPPPPPETIAPSPPVLLPPPTTPATPPPLKDSRNSTRSAANLIPHASKLLLLLPLLAFL